MALTDQEVQQLFDQQGNYAFPFKKLCARCGAEWIIHFDVNCPNGTTTFLPVEESASTSVCIEQSGGCGSCNDCAKKTEEIPEWKKWRNDQPGNCACGIVREDCWIHKDN
jgi:hypothetical protein